MSKKRCDGLLARVDFPLYTLQTLTNRHVLVAGGGGASNTGVANGFEIFELSHNGTRFVAEEVMRHETGPNVVMTCSVRSQKNRTYLTAGQESHCQLYKVNIRMVDAAEMRRGSFRAENGLVRRRRRTVSENDNISNTNKQYSNTAKKWISFEIRPSDSVQTDFGNDPLQRVVRISHSCKLMATGGIDTKVRIWSFPKMELMFELDGHTKELDDLDFSPCDSRLVSIGKDGLANIWATSKKQPPLLKITCQPPNGTKYLFRRCRFAPIEDKDSYRMFTIANPLTRSGKQKGLIQQWDPTDGSLTKSVVVAESLSALAVRDDGRFLGIGTMFSGSVDIYVAFSLQRVLHVKSAHMMFVTGLEFLPVRGFGPAVTARSEAALLSISVDNCLCVHSLPYRKCSAVDCYKPMMMMAALLSISVDICLCVHSLPYQSTVPAWVAILLIIFVLFCTFTLCSYLGI